MDSSDNMIMTSCVKYEIQVMGLKEKKTGKNVSTSVKFQSKSLVDQRLSFLADKQPQGKLPE